MRKSLYTIFTILLFTTCLLADFINSTPVGPGVIHHHELRLAGPWHIHVLEIDLSDSLNKIETIKAENNISGYERTSSMAARSDGPLHRAIGGVNGDFYASGGVSIGAQIIKGTLLKRPYPRSVFAMSDDKQPMIDIVNFQGQITSPGNQILNINGVNETRQENNLILYNRFHGSSTRTNQWGTEILVDYIDDMMVNASVRAVVTQMDSSMTVGNMSIPGKGSAILSGHGTARDFLNAQIDIGDTIVVKVGLPPIQENLLELLGGTPRLITDGTKRVDWEKEGVGSSFTYDRHPRTAVGYSQDGTKLYFFTVDGRQPGRSVGMSLFELADYMLAWGVYQGVNLDGGGSTTMVVRGEVKNKPSDGAERSVANSLLVISTAPEGGPLANLYASHETAYVLVDGDIQFTVTGSDLYHNPLPLGNVDLTWTCDPNIGTITETGLLSAASDTTSGYVTVSANGVIDSILVHVTTVASISLAPEEVVLKVGETQEMSVTAADNFGNPVEVAPETYDWTVTPEIASISDAGVVSAENVGSGLIQVAHRDVSTSVPLTVGTKAVITIDDFTSTDAYAVSGLRVDLPNCSFLPSDEQFVSSPTSGKLTYSMTVGGTTVLYLDCNHLISGTPESVSLQVYGDSSRHWLRGEFKVPNGDYMLIDFTDPNPGIDWKDSWKELTVMLTDAKPKFGYPDAVLDFPITWTKIYLAETNDAKKDAGVIYLDDFAAQYISTSIDDAEVGTPRAFALMENYPNPFNAATNFIFKTPKEGMLEMRMYDINGREVDFIQTQVHPGQNRLTWQPDQLPSGIYLLNASLGDQQVQGKCLLLK